MTRASIYFGADCIVDRVEVDFSIRGVERALADRLTRAEYRRVYRGRSPKGTSKLVAGSDRSTAWIETRNDDGSRGATYTIVER